MIDGSEKGGGWLNFELQSPHVIERRSKGFYSSKLVLPYKMHRCNLRKWGCRLESQRCCSQ